MELVPPLRVSLPKSVIMSAYSSIRTGAQALATQLGDNAISGAMDVCSCEATGIVFCGSLPSISASLDVSANNAGLLCRKFEQIELSRHLDQLQVNVNGVLLGCYKARPYLKSHANAQNHQSLLLGGDSRSAGFGQLAAE